VTADGLTRLLGDLDDTGAGVLVISPHLDDALLSCGALLAHLAPRHPITVATVFTAAATSTAGLHGGPLARWGCRSGPGSTATSPIR
jgi:hypothetical protein